MIRLVSIYCDRFAWNSISSANAVSSFFQVSSLNAGPLYGFGLKPGARIGSNTARRSPLVGRSIFASEASQPGGSRSVLAHADWFIPPLSLCRGSFVSDGISGSSSQFSRVLTVRRGLSLIEERGITLTRSPREMVANGLQGPL